MLFLLGLACEKRGELEEAIDAYGEALEVDEADWRAHFHLGRLCLNVGLVSAAASHLQATLDGNPEFEPAQLAMKKLEGIDIEALQATFDESLDEMNYGDGPGLPEPEESVDFDMSSLGPLFDEPVQ